VVNKLMQVRHFGNGIALGKMFGKRTHNVSNLILMKFTASI
jgi:hypothetical protein